MKLREAVKVLRSKNAGVWHITIDIVFKNRELYERAKDKLNRDYFCRLFNRKNLGYFECDGINTLKISFLRNSAAGSLSDTDCLGANFYIPLLDVEI